MASKNKKIKEPGADKNVFNMIRDYCNAPWVSTNKELPTPNTFVLLAYYAGEDVGYRMAMWWNAGTSGRTLTWHTPTEIFPLGLRQKISRA